MMSADGVLSSAEAARHHHYREVGWWPGEPLLARYARLSAASPDSLAVADSRGRLLTHAQLQRVAASYAETLTRASVTPGDVVLMAMPNCVEWQAAFMGILLIDAIPATIPSRIDAANLLHVAEVIGARALVVPDKEVSKELEDIAQHVVDACSHQIDLIVVSIRGDIRHRPATAHTRPAKPGIRGLDHIAFTSSTTGRPKAVMHTCDTLAALNLTFSERFGLGADTPIFMPSPLGHSVGSYHGSRLSLFNAAPLVLQERWDPEAAIRMVSDFRCAFTAAATPFLTDLVNAEASSGIVKLDTIRWFLCGGAQVPPSLINRTIEEFPNTKVTALWGMTEGGLTTCHTDSPREKFRTTCGVGLPGLELRTIDGEGNPLPAGSQGELVMRGPGIFIGYLGQSDLYQSSLTADGFFRTGDLAVIDPEGYVSITGRAKDLIIRGGVNISPVPIEDALAAHPNIASVAIVGAPDARMGELLCAFIEPRGRRVELSEIQTFVRESGLPKYLAPEALRFVEEMPRTPAGKIRKVDLKRLFDDELSK
jgi:acyl-CoA synthetase (AMP-forming)/AMP-acid ligase II